jgi:hypothetical protein
MQTLAQLREQGISATAIANNLSAQLRARITNSPADKWELSLLKQLLEVSVSARPQDYLEICVLEASASVPQTTPKIIPPSNHNDSSSTNEEKPVEKTLKTRPTTSNKHMFKPDDWPKIVDMVKTEAASIYTALRLAEPRIEEDLLTLAFQFPLHQKKMSVSKSKDLLGRIIEEATGSTPKIECIVDKSITPAVAKDVSVTVNTQPTSGPMANISNIFGGAEVLES